MTSVTGMPDRAFYSALQGAVVLKTCLITVVNSPGSVLYRNNQNTEEL